MSEIRKYDYVIRSRDVDFLSKTMLTAMLEYVLETAGKDADLHGSGIRQLKEMGNAWVLSRFALEIYDQPKEGDEIQVGTWVSDANRLFTTRNFEVLAADGKRLGAVLSQWAMLNLTTRTAIDLRNIPLYANLIQKDILPLIEKPVKIHPLTDPDKTQEHIVTYSDVDFNKHANSIKYIQWLIDMVPIEWIEKKRIFRVDINYIHEALYGEKLLLLCKEGDEMLFEVQRTTSQTAACRAKIGWK